MDTKYRPAVRIVCLDSADRVLLLHWRDPYDASQLWEPPGGGIEPGETPLDAARRELVEETGLDPATIGERSLTVQRDIVWNGNRYVGPEEFFLARFDADAPALARTGLLPDEQVNLQEHEWVPRSGLAVLPGRLEPPELATVIDELVVL